MFKLSCRHQDTTKLSLERAHDLRLYPIASQDITRYKKKIQEVNTIGKSLENEWFMKCMKSSVRMRQWGGVDAKNIKEIANKEIPPSCNFIGKF